MAGAMCLFFLLVGIFSCWPNHLFAQARSIEVLKSGCGNLFVPRKLPPTILDVPIEAQAAACIETVSSPARLLLRLDVAVAINKVSKSRDEAVKKFNDKKACSGDENAYVTFESATPKFDKALPVTSFDHAAVVIEAYARPCAFGRAILPYFHFDVDLPIVVIANNEEIGLGLGDPNISLRTGTSIINRLVFDKIYAAIEDEVKSSAKKVKFALPLTKEHFKKYQPEIKQVRFQFVKDTLLIDVQATGQVAASEVRSYILSYVDEMLPR